MNALRVLIAKDLRLFVRDRATLMLTFIIPFALIYLFGLVFGVNKKDPGPQGIPLAVVNQSPDPAAARLVDALRAEKTFRVITTKQGGDSKPLPLGEADLPALIRADEFRFALVIPPDLIAPDRLRLHFKFYTNPLNEIETQTINGLLEKTIFTQAPQLIGEALQARERAFLGSETAHEFDARIADAVAGAFHGDRDAILRDIEEGNLGFGRADRARDGSTAGGSSPDFLSRLVTIDTEQVSGKQVKQPVATSLVGGWAVQFLLFALTASAVAFFHEKQAGLFHRILAAPVSRSQILASKFLYGIIVGLIQLCVLFTAGMVLYGIDVAHHVPMLLLVCTFAAAACTAFGMVIAAVTSTPEAARGISTFAILIMSAIGGAWFPVSFMPESIQHLSRLTVVYWSIHGFEQVLWAGASLRELAPTLGILAGMTAGLMGVAVWRFNRGRLFD